MQEPIKEYIGFVLPESGGAGGSTTSIPWEVSFGTGRVRVLVTYTSAVEVARLLSLLRERHEDAASNRLVMDDISEDERADLERALAMCGFGNRVGNESVVEILQSGWSIKDCAIPHKFRSLLDHTKVGSQLHLRLS